MVSGDANPYRLLEQNFDRKTVLDAVYLYQPDKTGEQESLIKHDDERTHSEVTSFTYDKDHEHLTAIGSQIESPYGSLKRIGGSLAQNERHLTVNKAPMDTIVEEDDVPAIDFAASVDTDRTNSE